MEKSSKALRWIVGILCEHQIPFQIAGGLAAKVYGSTRELDDIDIDIPEESFAVIQPLVQSHIIFGPEQFNDENWQIFLMTCRTKIEMSAFAKIEMSSLVGQDYKASSL